MISVPAGKHAHVLLSHPPWHHQQDAFLQGDSDNEDVCRGQVMHGWFPQRTQLVKGTVQLAPEEAHDSSYCITLMDKKYVKQQLGLLEEDNY